MSDDTWDDDPVCQEGFRVALVDNGTMVGLAFTKGDGPKRVRWACLLHPAAAQALAMSLQAAASEAFRKQGDVLIDSLDVEWKHQ